MKGLQRKVRAVSSMLGAVFFVVVVLIGLNLMFFSLAQNMQLENAIVGAQSRSQDKLAEGLQVLLVRMSACTGTKCAINLTLFNAGGRPIHIVRVYVANQTYAGGSYTVIWRRSFDTNFMIATSSIQTNIGSNLGIFQSSSIYSIILITDRGNSVSARYAPNTSILQTASGIGWLTMDLSYYYYYYSGGKTDPDHGPYSAWCVLGGTNQKTFMFTTSVINHWDRDVDILPHSYLVLYSKNGGVSSFYIMAPGTTAQGSQNGQGAYNPPTTPYIVVTANPTNQQAGGTAVPLIFLASAPGSTSQSAWGPGSNSAASYAAIVILFYQDVSGNVLAQTIPFQATEVQPSSATSCF